MKNAEKYGNVWYAALTVPAAVRHIIGHGRFYKSTQTGIDTEAYPRVVLLVAGWRAEIAKARGRLPDPSASFWENLRREYIEANGEGTQLAIEEVAQNAAMKVADPVEGARLYKLATNQLGTLLAPLVTDWKSSLKLAKKTIDQMHRDVLQMSAKLVTLDALEPKTIKAWTDKLVKDGATAATIERLGKACRSFWLYLQHSGEVDMIEADPFVGPFKLAKGVAPRTKTGRSGSSYTPEGLALLYAGAVKKGDSALADLIALGAYTGARIEELCQLTAETARSGVFRMGTKTEASERETPVHPAAVALVDRLIKASKGGYLIPSAADNQYGNRSGPLSQRFGHLKKAMEYGASHVFHSTRNTLATLMDQAGVAEGIAADVVGHEKKTMTYGLYSSGSSMKQKLDAISKVAYPAPLDMP